VPCERTTGHGDSLDPFSGNGIALVYCSPPLVPYVNYKVGASFREFVPRSCRATNA